MRSVRSSQSPPPRSTFIVWFSETLLVAAAAPAAAPAISRRPGRVQPVVAQGLAGIGSPVVAVGQEDGLVNSLGGRGKGTPS